jgi:hypothetical protein
VIVTERLGHTDAKLIVVDRPRADALRLALHDLDELLGGER